LFTYGVREGLAPVRATKGESVQRDQTILEMAEKVLERQARALVARTEQTFEAAMVTVANTDAGQQLRELANGEHRDQRASEWQASILRKRIEERHYSWVEGCMEWLKGKEERAEYHALLEEELASLKG
jgi:hypothetical protein